jgi:hypothetical protein
LTLSSVNAHIVDCALFHILRRVPVRTTFVVESVKHNRWNLHRSPISRLHIAPWRWRSTGLQPSRKEPPERATRETHSGAASTARKECHFQPTRCFLGPLGVVCRVSRRAHSSSVKPEKDTPICSQDFSVRRSQRNDTDTRTAKLTTVKNLSNHQLQETEAEASSAISRCQESYESRRATDPATVAVCYANVARHLPLSCRGTAFRHALALSPPGAVDGFKTSSRPWNKKDHKRHKPRVVLGCLDSL